jgi:hypothetical protein
MEVFGRVVSLGVLLFQFEGNAPETDSRSRKLRSYSSDFSKEFVD